MLLVVLALAVERLALGVHELLGVRVDQGAKHLGHGRPDVLRLLDGQVGQIDRETLTPGARLDHGTPRPVGPLEDEHGLEHRLHEFGHALRLVRLRHFSLS